jgi:hypothetical protein
MVKKRKTLDDDWGLMSNSEQERKCLNCSFRPRKQHLEGGTIIQTLQYDVSQGPE